AAPPRPGTACPTPGSAPGCSSARARASTTLTRSSPSSASAPGASSTGSCLATWTPPGQAKPKLRLRHCHAGAVPRGPRERCAEKFGAFGHGGAHVFLFVVQRDVGGAVDPEQLLRLLGVPERLRCHV